MTRGIPLGASPDPLGKNVPLAPAPFELESILAYYILEDNYLLSDHLDSLLSPLLFLLTFR